MFTLISGYEDGWMWQIQAVVRRDGSIESTGRIITEEHRGNHKYKVRAKDGMWVAKNLPKTFRNKYPENHHDWENGDHMYMLTHDEHVKLHENLSG